MRYVTLLLSASVVFVQCQSSRPSRPSNDKPCENRIPEEVSVNVNSQRNQTGYWISQVELVSKVNAYQHTNPETSGKVNIKHSTVQCGDESSARVLLTITEPPLRVASDYEHFPRIGYYKFHTDAATWIKARDTCAVERAHLAIIDSKEESDVVLELFKKNPKVTGSTQSTMDWAWVGVFKDETDKQFSTLFGDLLTKNSFMKWHPGQPDDKTVNRSVGVSASRSTAYLNDLEDSWKLAFVCEQEL